MGLFDSWSGFAGGLASGLEDLGGFVSQNLGAIAGGIATIEAAKSGKAPPPPSNAGNIGKSGGQQASGFDLPGLLTAFGYGPPGSAPAESSSGLPVGTLLILLAGVVVVVLVKKA